jgi:exodeoxyribonuclease III
MLVATYNVNSISARLDFVLDFLRTVEPDVVLVQELKLEDAKFPLLPFAQLGYKVVTHGQAQWNGVAIFFRDSFLGDHAPEVRLRGLPGFEESGARLLTASARGFDFTTVYVPNGKTTSHPDFAMKLRWLEGLADHLASSVRRDVPSIVGGDFNLCPADIDSWDGDRARGAIFHTDAERAIWKRILGEHLVDLFRVKEPETQTFSWWDYRAGAFHKKMGLRIDFLLGSADVLERTERVTIERDFRKKRDGRIPSDHAPVLAWIRD